MKKRGFIFWLSLALCLGLMLPALAEGVDSISNAYPRVLDMAELLTASERQALLEQLDEISARQRLDVVVATTQRLNGASAQDCADDLYDQCGFGYGAQHDGVLLLISLEDREWHISTCGYGITVFTDAGIAYIGKQIKPDLSDGNYAAAFERFAALCDEFAGQAHSGAPYDKGTLPRGPLSPLWIPACLVIGFVIAALVVGNMKGKLKSVRAQAAADSYFRDGSLNISECRDIYLYHTVQRTEKPRNDSSSGSSTHTSSSGTTHGGGGGSF